MAQSLIEAPTQGFQSLFHSQLLADNGHSESQITGPTIRWSMNVVLSDITSYGRNNPLASPLI